MTHGAISSEELQGRHSEIVEELKNQLRDRDRILKEYKTGHGKLELFFNELYENISPLTPLQPVFQSQNSKSGSSVTPVLHITDTHIGMVQFANEIEGFNAFNFHIAELRSMEVARLFYNWVTAHRNRYNIRKCTVFITGDLISGDIHDELKVTNEFPVPVQCVKTAQVIVNQLYLLAPNFEEVVVEMIGEDNHSRLTKKPQAKEAGFNTYNYVIFHLIEAYMRNTPNVKLRYHPMLEKVIQVENYRYLLCHGHNVKGWMGVPWYGIERKVGKESQARMQLIMEDFQRAKDIGFNKYCHGHFHTPFVGELYRCGASLSGTDAYDHQAGRYSHPGQSAWLVHEEWGEIDNIVLKLQHIQD